MEQRVALTEQEDRIMEEFAYIGHTVDQTAEALGLTVTTVKKDLRNICRKFGVQNRKAAIDAYREFKKAEAENDPAIRQLEEMFDGALPKNFDELAE